MAAFDIEAYFRAELARLDGGSGEPQATIIQLAQLYDLAPCDGRLDWDEWQAFIGDLLCIRDGVLEFEPGTVAHAARAIAGAGFSGERSDPNTIGVEELVDLGNTWPSVLRRVADTLAGPPRLKMLHDPVLLEDVRALRAARDAGDAGCAGGGDAGGGGGSTGARASGDDGASGGSGGEAAARGGSDRWVYATSGACCCGNPVSNEVLRSEGERV